MNIYATGLPASAFNHLEIIVPSVQSVCLWPWPLHITHHLWLLPTQSDLHCICCYSKNKISLSALQHFTILCLPSTSRKKADWKAFSQHIRCTLPAFFGPLGQYKPLEILDFGFESSEGCFCMICEWQRQWRCHQCPSMPMPMRYSLLTCSSSQFIWKGNFPTGHSRPWTFTLDTLEFYTDHHMNAVKCRWWHQRGSRQARGYVPGLSPLNPDRRNPPPISLSPPPTPSTPLLPSCVVKTSHDRRPHAFKRTPQWWGLHVKSGEHCEAVLPEQRAHHRHPHLLPLGLSHPCRPPRSRLLDLRRLVQARFHRN